MIRNNKLHISKLCCHSFWHATSFLQTAMDFILHSQSCDLKIHIPQYTFTLFQCPAYSLGWGSSIPPIWCETLPSEQGSLAVYTSLLHNSRTTTDQSSGDGISLNRFKLVNEGSTVMKQHRERTILSTDNAHRTLFLKAVIIWERSASTSSPWSQEHQHQVLCI